MPKVLLVEDDPFIVRLYTKTLEHEGYEIQAADNGLSALEQVPVYKPDVILLDIMMPTMNGVEFLKNLSAGGKTPTVPVIVLTNVSDSDVTLEAVNAGASLVLLKSQAEPDDVIDAIKGVLDKDILQSGSLDNESNQAKPNK